MKHKDYQLIFIRFLLLFLVLSIFDILFAGEQGNEPDKIFMKEQVIAYLKKTKSIRDTLPRQSLKLTSKALRLSKKINDNTLTLEAYGEKVFAYYLLSIMDSVLLYSDSIIASPALTKDALAKAKLFQSVAYREKGKYDEAIVCINKSIDVYWSNNDTTGAMNATLSLANILNIKGDNKQAMKYYYQVLKYAERINDTLFQGGMLNAIANVYLDINEVKKGMEYYRKSIRLLRHYNNSWNYADALNNYGEGLKNNKEYDSALYYYAKALAIYKRLGMKSGVAVTYQNTGRVQILQKSYTIGMQNLYFALRIYQSLKLDDELVNVYMSLGAAYKDYGQVDSAIIYLEKSIKLAEKLESPYEKKKSLNTLYQLFKSEKNYQKALLTYSKYVQLKDSVENTTMKQHLQELEANYKTLQKEKAIEVLEKDKKLDKLNLKRRQWERNASILAFLLLVILVFVMIQKRKRERQLAIMRNEKNLLQKQELEQKLDFQSRQLTTHALNMLQKNKLLQSLQIEIKEVSTKTKQELKPELKSLAQKININLKGEKDWELFKMYFEQVNKDFFKKITNKYTKLTSGDLRLIALLKLNLNTKEIASILNLSPDSVKNARHRLRKKLQMNPEEELFEFISRL